jgi:hypothetical protein
MPLPLHLFALIVVALGASPLRAAESSAVQLTVEASDPDGDPLHYRWSLASGPSDASVRFGSSNDSASGGSCTATVDRVGSYVFAVTVSDGAGGSAVSTTGTIVCVRAAGSAPVGSAPAGAAGGKRGCGLGSGFTALLVAGCALAMGAPRRDRG